VLQIPDFEERFRVIAFDNRDSGRSSLANGPYTIADMASDTARLMDALGIDRAHVLGVSMGGTIAQELAISHPGRIERLILVCTMAQFASFHVSPIQVWKWLRRRDLENRVFPIEVISWCMTHRFLRDSRAVEEMIEQFRNPPYPVPAEAFCRQVDALCGFDRADRVKEIQAPTRVVVGAEDILTPPWAVQGLASRIPGAQLEVLDGGGHCLFWEIPDRFNRAVIDFLTP
jgi:pimeloyl-ACP methyl ester carboxylesterase